MAHIKTRVTWNHGPILQKAALGHKVYENIVNDTTTFASPPMPILNDMKAKATALEKAWNNRKGIGGTSALDRAEKAFEKSVYLVAAYVDGVANGSASIIEKAGFVATKGDRQPKTLPGATIIEKMVSEVAGEVKVTVKTIENAASYLYVCAIGTAPQLSILHDQVRVKGAEEVYIKPDGDRVEIFKDLPAGQKATVWVAAQNTAGIGPLSAPQSKMIQI